MKLDCFFKEREKINPGCLFYEKKKSGTAIWKVEDILTTYDLNGNIVKTEVSAKRLNFPFPCSGNFPMSHVQRYSCEIISDE